MEALREFFESLITSISEAVSTFLTETLGLGAFELPSWDLSQFPSIARIVAAMDPIAWTLLGLLMGAVVLGVYFTVTSRRPLMPIDEVETTPDIIMERLKQDPTYLMPTAILSRLGADATLTLLDYGDRQLAPDWRYKWGGVREALLMLMSQQNAFGPTYALARYYRSADTQEPDTLRIRRSALIHKLGIRRFLPPDGNGNAAQLRVRAHPAEIQGDLGFDGPILWLMPDEPVPPAIGPVIEMGTVEFRTLQEAELQLHIRRTPMVGGGFRLHMQKRRKMWIVVQEDVEWVS